VLAIILLMGMGFISATTWKFSGDIFYYENGTKKICKHVEDSGTIWLGENIVTKYYKVENCSNLPAGGVHLIIDCYKKSEDTLEISTKVYCDNYTPKYDAYYFRGMFEFNDDTFMINLKPGERRIFGYKLEPPKSSSNVPLPILAGIGVIAIVVIGAIIKIRYKY